MKVLHEKLIEMISERSRKQKVTKQLSEAIVSLKFYQLITFLQEHGNSYKEFHKKMCELQPKEMSAMMHKNYGKTSQLIKEPQLKTRKVLKANSTL